MGTVKNIHILVGLPGSGKTSWAISQLKHYKDRLYDCDAYIKNKQYTNENIRETLVNEGHYASIVLNGYEESNIYVDGLFLTESAVETVIDSTFEMMSHYSSHDRANTINFIIEQWDCNREACIFNDNKRIEQGDRAINAKVTIKYVPYDEYIDIENLELHLGITLNSYPNFKTINITFKRNEHTVIAYGGEESFVYKYSPTHDGYLISDSWSMGGDWANCWGNEGTISPEPQPDFVQLENLLEKICPNITFLQYKRLNQECVEVVEKGYPDYYGGCEHRAWYKCDLNKLYNYLKQNNLIKDE